MAQSLATHKAAQNIVLWNDEGFVAAVRNFRSPLALVWDSVEKRYSAALTDDASGLLSSHPALALIGQLPPIFPEWLGDRSFTEEHGLRFAYIAGEMARGISTAKMVASIGRAGMLGFFGAAGLEPAEVAKAIDEIHHELRPGAHSWGVNLIHSPDAPGREDDLVDLFLQREVRRMSASAFMALSPAVARYSASGLSRDPSGRIIRRNHVFAKLSRAEVAEAFMSPPPARMLQALVAAGKLSEGEAELAAQLPVAQDILAEGDSGGHTDNRPLGSLLPILFQLAERVAARHRFTQPCRVGAAGGIGTPEAMAAAFAAGAAFVATGSVNQSCVESALSPAAKAMLAEASASDVAMAPSADMFELGAKVQVLKKGTLFAQRASRLHELYRRYDSLDDIPTAVRDQLERDIFRRSLDEVWRDASRFFSERDPDLLARAARDPKQRMALAFRWYLGLSSRWPLKGDIDRKLDFQIWCGPAQGAFNNWVEGSFLAPLENRSVVQVARNLLEGAAVVTRAHQLRTMGAPVPMSAFRFAPRPLA